MPTSTVTEHAPPPILVAGAAHDLNLTNNTHQFAVSLHYHGKTTMVTATEALLATTADSASKPDDETLTLKGLDKGLDCDDPYAASNDNKENNNDNENNGNDKENNNNNNDNGNDNININNNNNGKLHAKQNAKPADSDRADKPLRSGAHPEFRDIASKLFNEEFVLINPAEYTQFLAAPDADSSRIREYYMDMFQWDASLMTSTRRLCLKLYLKGESQEIDRILSAFTKSYLKQHPTNVFCTRDFEKIYIVLYSLILLNTALHNSELTRKLKISQTDYIKNTLLTFLQQNKKALKLLSIKQKIQIERELNVYYEDLAHRELYLKKGDDTAPSTPKKAGNKRYSIAETIRSSYSHVSEPDQEKLSPRAPLSPMVNDNTMTEISRQPSNNSIWSADYEAGRRTSLSVKRMVSGASGVSQVTASNPNFHRPTKDARFGFTRALVSDNAQRSAASTLRNQRSYDQLRHGHPLTRRSSRTSVITNNSTSSARNDDAISVLVDDAVLDAFDVTDDGGYQYQLEDFDVDDFQDKTDLKLELQGAPYLKEGLLKLRILNNDLADSVSGEPPVASSTSLAMSVSTQKLGFLSFFNRSFASREPAAATVGTGSNNVFSHKFTEYFVVVSKGELRLYSFDPKLVKKQQMMKKKLRKANALLMFEPEEPADIGDGNWLKNAANVGNYNLCSSIAQIERHAPHGSGPKKVHWSLTFPKVTKKQPKRFIFEAGTVEVASEFINTCNFWALKITAIPTLEESVSSLEYGWSNLNGLASLGDGFKKTKTISKWEQLPKGVYLSNYVIGNADDEAQLSHEGILKQFVQTLKYYNNLKSLYNNFNQGKTKFMKGFRKFSGSSNYKLITSNYEARLSEYKTELSKYKSYLVLLGYGLKLRFDADTEDKEEEWTRQIKEENPEITEEKLEELLQQKQNEDKENEPELTKVVRLEIDKLIATSSEMHQLLADDPKYSVADLPRSIHEPEFFDTNNSLVKSPKTFSLSNFKDIESSPINQLLSADGKHVGGDSEQGLHQAKKELIMSFSTNTIKEEDEPEDLED